MGSDKLSTALTSYDPKARIWYVPVRGFEQNHVPCTIIRGILKRFFFFPREFSDIQWQSSVE